MNKPITYNKILESLSKKLIGTLYIKTSHTHGFEVDLNDIIYLQGKYSHTHVWLTEHLDCLALHHIGFYQEDLDPRFFFRINNSAIINLLHVKEIQYQPEKLITLSDNHSVKPSESKWKAFKTRYEQFLEGKISFTP